MNHLRARRITVLALTVGITALGVAACGSSSSSSTGSSSSSSSSAAAGAGGTSRTGFDRTKLTACLKSHGVTLPSRPAGAGAGGGTPPSGSGTRRPGGGGFFGGGAGGRFANNPKLQAAFKACGGGQAVGGGRRFGLNHAAVTKFVACVKQHGYDLPAPNFSGKGAVFPASIEKNKKFQSASKACAADLRPTGGPGGAGAPGGGPPSGATGTTGA
jgi:hypothetical protein